MSNNTQHMFAVSFNRNERRFSLESTEAFIGKPIYDLDEDLERYAEDSFEEGIHVGMKNILASAIAQLNNILATQEAQDELDIVEKLAYDTTITN